MTLTVITSPIPVVGEEEDEDEDFSAFLTAVTDRVMGDFEGPIDMHIRTDRNNITVAVCRNNPTSVHFYMGNATEYFQCEGDEEESLDEMLVSGVIDQPFEAEMLSRVFIEHILLNPENQPGITADQPERTES